MYDQLWRKGRKSREEGEDLGVLRFSSISCYAWLMSLTASGIVRDLQYADASGIEHFKDVYPFKVNPRYTPGLPHGVPDSFIGRVTLH
ncbi:transmembrane protein, putative [Medicago truncatula]|uniref:Transmembrane protein, putative n=1 Tax=Medicago truncatula TaxID=3880 RepID=A0A072TQU6_MEDTR|nr:transmembrane protein, putative [Medicago truncatula]